MTTVAVLGTGRMGSAMARRLLGTGHTVTVWNRSADKARPLGDAGATVADTVADAIAGAAIVVTMLFDADSTEQTLEDAWDAFGDDTVWLQSGTVGPDGTRELAALAARHDVDFVDLPVLGAPEPAAQGKLVLLPAGDRDLEPRIDDVLSALGDRRVWVADEPGRASLLKLVVNAWLATLTEGIAQSIALSRGLGLDPQTFLDAIDGHALAAPYGMQKGAAMLAGDFAPHFSIDSIVKDVDLALDAVDAEGADVTVDLLEVVHRHLDDAARDGHGDDDIAAVLTTFDDARDR